MRLICLITAALILVMPRPSFAQEWIQYVSRADFFAVNFPGQPKVQDITYPTEYGRRAKAGVPKHAYVKTKE